jgi:hypothetical protein
MPDWTSAIADKLVPGELISYFNASSKALVQQRKTAGLRLSLVAKG